MTNEHFEAMWSPLFFDFQTGNPIFLKATDSEGKAASVRIFFDKEKSTVPLQILPGMQQVFTAVVPIAFERHAFDGEESTLFGTINQHGQFYAEPGKELGAATDFFPSTWQSNAVQVANWFSALSIKNIEADAVEAVKKQFPEILELSVQSPSQFPALYAMVKFRTQKLPVSLISSGINKFISLLVAIKNYSPGVVLIDEIENGIYYKMFPALWESLHGFAVKSDTQLFLTTHSWECLKNAVPIIEKNPNDFNVIQVYQEEGRGYAVVVPGSDAAAAIESDIEVRR
jgi:hypothetical protein